MLNPGDMVEAWDWPEIETLVFGELRRAKVRGKVAAAEDGMLHVWTETHAGIWSNLRTIPAEFVIRRKPRTDEDRRERERVRLRRKRQAYAAVGVKG